MYIGKFNTLTVKRFTDNGCYLSDKNGEEVLLPRRFCSSETIAIGDVLQVFVYSDSADRLIATMEKPLAQVGEFAYLKVKDINDIGAFLDWGLTKDLLVPFREQKTPMSIGKQYMVKLYVDERSQRVVASSKIHKFLSQEFPEFNEGEEVQILICDLTDIGYQCIVDNDFVGLLYQSEVFRKINLGDLLYGYVKKIRADGKIDLSLQKIGYQKVKDETEPILSYLQAAGGEMTITDKSDPQLIYKTFGISKKSFKAALGALYKRHLIIIEPNCIRLLPSE
ncbi:MAG: S1-like domain-containing RNA-binding protein [Bacteroidales bacterium]|nr:S1-like domain-containing RNA-binding protein [Bacteroidales bacterium]